tara:strand:+ start:118 stop:372 length:255 start_codon:yes stop_codon:yes gene_type:complete
MSVTSPNNRMAVIEQNRSAAKSTISPSTNFTTVDYDESTGAFAVRCNGEVMEWFPTRQAAIAFANEHDHVSRAKLCGEDADASA